jgi:hypothetical protein
MNCDFVIDGCLYHAWKEFHEMSTLTVKTKLAIVCLCIRVVFEV